VDTYLFKYKDVVKTRFLNICVLNDLTYEFLRQLSWLRVEFLFYKKLKEEPVWSVRLTV